MTHYLMLEFSGIAKFYDTILLEALTSSFKRKNCNIEKIFHAKKKKIQIIVKAWKIDFLSREANFKTHSENYQFSVLFVAPKNAKNAKITTYAHLS